MMDLLQDLALPCMRTIATDYINFMIVLRYLYTTLLRFNDLKADIIISLTT